MSRWPPTFATAMRRRPAAVPLTRSVLQPGSCKRALMTFRLRKAEGADLDFIWRLRVATMKEAISQSYGWDEGTQRGYAAESLRGEIVLIDERRSMSPRVSILPSSWLPVAQVAWHRDE
jgi:hypothetical protein